MKAYDSERLKRRIGSENTTTPFETIENSARYIQSEVTIMFSAITMVLNVL